MKFLVNTKVLVPTENHTVFRMGKNSCFVLSCLDKVSKCSPN